MPFKPPVRARDVWRISHGRGEHNNQTDRGRDYLKGKFFVLLFFFFGIFSF